MKCGICYCVIFHMNNWRPAFAHPCIYKTAPRSRQSTDTLALEVSSCQLSGIFSYILWEEYPPERQVVIRIENEFPLVRNVPFVRNSFSLSPFPAPPRALQNLGSGLHNHFVPR